MADLYKTHSRSSSIESEEISSFLHNLLHDSSTAPSSSCISVKTKHMPSLSSPPTPPPPLASPAGVLGRSATVLSVSNCQLSDGAATVVADSSFNLNFSDLGGFLSRETKESLLNSFYSAGAIDSAAITSERREVPANLVPPSSSKRSRETAIHNLAEKRRRGRINEKLKALQNLIPDSNKTDKASMLDEAIEYLKQLQLQVQMLTMRNGLNLHPLYLPETPQRMQLPQRVMDYDEENRLRDVNRGDTFSGNQEILSQTAFDISNHTSQNQLPIVIPSLADINNSEALFGLEPSIQNQTSARLTHYQNCE